MRVIYFDMKGIFAVNIFLNLAIPKSHSERSSSVSAEKLRIAREKTSNFVLLRVKRVSECPENSTKNDLREVDHQWGISICK